MCLMTIEYSVCKLCADVEHWGQLDVQNDNVCSSENIRGRWAVEYSKRIICK